jgi:hypothetical protein
MTIPPSLAEILQLLFGPDWRRRGPPALKRSRRQIGRWCSEETRIPRHFLVLLSRQVDAEVEDIERWQQDQHRRVDEAAHARKGDAFSAGMWLRSIVFDRPDWEPTLRVGRPRKISQAPQERLGYMPAEEARLIPQVDRRRAAHRPRLLRQS